MPRCPCFPGAGGVSVGTKHPPHMVRSFEPAWPAVGAARGRLRRGVPRAAARGAWGQALVLPRGRAGGARRAGAVGACVRAWGPVTVPLACVVCVPSGGLRAAGVAEGRPRAWTSPRCEGPLLSGGFPLPAASPWRRAARPCCPCFPRVGGVRAGTQYRPHGVRSCDPALRAVPLAGGRPRGGCIGHLSSGARPFPAARPRGGQSGSAAHVLWARACRHGARHCPLGVRALRGAARRGTGGRSFREMGDLSPL